MSRPIMGPTNALANLEADLSQVASILDGPARDSEVVKVARDRIDQLRKRISDDLWEYRKKGVVW